MLSLMLQTRFCLCSIQRFDDLCSHTAVNNETFAASMAAICPLGYRTPRLSRKTAVTVDFPTKLFSFQELYQFSPLLPKLLHNPTRAGRRCPLRFNSSAYQYNWTGSSHRWRSLISLGKAGCLFFSCFLQCWHCLLSSGVTHYGIRDTLGFPQEDSAPFAFISQLRSLYATAVLMRITFGNRYLRA
jgi:hypothetical protein